MKFPMNSAMSLRVDNHYALLKMIGHNRDWFSKVGVILDYDSLIKVPLEAIQ